jgi:hypothetical protein
MQSDRTTPAASTSNLVPCAISGRDPKITLKVYADCLVVETKQPPLPGDDLRMKNRSPGGQRGNVTTFSNKSRKRLINAMTMKRAYVRPLFITLTFPDEVWFNGLGQEDVHIALNALRKRLGRFSSDAGMLWRIELQYRKSGLHIGEVAPHIHLIVDGLTHDVAELRKLFHSWWSEILGMPARIDLQVAKSRRHTMYYISKYVAKFENSNQCYKIQTFDESAESSGRWWGTALNWDTTPFEVIEIVQEELTNIRRTVAGWLKSKNSRYARRLKAARNDFGFTVYGLGAESSRKYHQPRDSAAYRLVEELVGFAL